MSTELLYTSAPQGLRLGSRGFCTVLTTAGMPINVIGKLEAISSYRHLFPPDSRQAAENPVALAHQKLNLGGQIVSVISRIAAYGTDYSGRTNKIAHHVAIDPSEMPLAGPAWLIRQRSILRSDWLGQCESPPSGPAIPRGDQPPRICSTWRTVAGDSGWGGVVAEAILSGDAQPLWIIYPLNQQGQLLELIDESISLLPASQRWRATFNTYAANIPPDVECKIRCVPVGTEEAKFAASNGKAIDLTKHQSITTASQWVERARGVMRHEPVAVDSEGSFNAVQEESVDQPIESAWSSANDPPPAPPTPAGPPSLPPELISGRKKRKQMLIAATILGASFLLGTTWVVARRMSGLPILPGSGPATPPTIPPFVPPPPEPKSPTEFRVPADVATSELKLHYDQKQVLAWALEDPTDETPLPNPISLRGFLRMMPLELPRDVEDQDEGDSDDELEAFGDEGGGSINAGSPRRRLAETESEATQHSPESSADLIAWGGEAMSFLPPEDFRVTTTNLTEGGQPMRVERFPYVPDSIAGTTLYWSRGTGDLIAVADLDVSDPSHFLSSQVSAYRTLASRLSKIASLVESLRKESQKLPQSMQNATELFVARSPRAKDSIIRSMMRTLKGDSDIAERAVALSDALREKQETATKPLNQTQQAALLQAVSDCGEIARASNELRLAFDVLNSGQMIEVPDMKFLDSEGVVLRRIPIRFHYSW